MEMIKTFEPYGPCPVCSTAVCHRKTGTPMAHDVKYVKPKVPGWLGRLFGRRLVRAHLVVTCIECGYTQKVPVGGASET